MCHVPLPAQSYKGGQEMINRRDFCKKSVLLFGTLAVPLAAFELFDPKTLLAEKNEGKGRALGIPGGHGQMRRLRVLRQGVQDRERGPLRRQCHPDLGGALRRHQGRQDPHRLPQGGAGRLHDSKRSIIGEGKFKEIKNRRISTRPSSSRSSATSATTRPASRSARSAPPTRPTTAWCWWTAPGASAAATASWAAPTGSGSSIRSTTWRKNAPSATTASPRG